MLRLGAEPPADEHLRPSRPATLPLPPGRPPAPRSSRRWCSPLKLAALPRASTMPTWRSCSIVSVRITVRSASSAVAPSASSSSPRSP